MARGKNRSSEEKAQWVAQWQASGLKAEAFADQHGLAVSSLYAWRRSLQLEPKQTKAFTEVRVRGEVSRSESVIELVLPNGVNVRLRGDVDARQLRKVLEVAQSC